MGVEVVLGLDNGIVIGAGGNWRQGSFVESGLTREELLKIYRESSYSKDHPEEDLGLVDPLHIFLNIVLSHGRVKIDYGKLKKMKVKKDVREAIRSFQRSGGKGKW
ncbi:MAG: hypothetical protein AAB697_03430 [Patescibacteria group bacterium]